MDSIHFQRGLSLLFFSQEDTSCEHTAGAHLLLMLALSVWVLLILGGLASTPDYSSFQPCPLQGCLAPSKPNTTLATCAEYQRVSCCNHEEDGRVGQLVASLQSMYGQDVDCFNSLRSFQCAVICSPFQNLWVSKDDTEIIKLLFNSSSCSWLFSQCANVVKPGDSSPISAIYSNAQEWCSDIVPSSWVNRDRFGGKTKLIQTQFVSVGGLDLSPSDSNRKRALPIEQLDPAASFVSQGLVHGGLTNTTQSFVMVTADQFQVPLTTGGSTVSADGSGISPFTSEVLDAQDGSYSGTFVVLEPDRYEIDARANSGLVSLSPFYLTYVEPVACLSAEQTVRLTSKPEPRLHRCQMYSENSCCNQTLVAELDDWFSYLDTMFGANSTCTVQLEIMACGMVCSPRNQVFFSESMDHLDPNCTVTPTQDCADSIIRVVDICDGFCGDIWETCRQVAPGGSGQTVEMLYSDANQFCSAQFPPSYLNVSLVPVFNTTNSSTCFDGLLREDSCARLAYPIDRTASIAGEVSSFTIVAVDCFQNQRIAGNDDFYVTITNTIDNSITVADVLNQGDGTYLINFVLFEACPGQSSCYVVDMSLEGIPIQNSPWRLTVGPNNPSENSEIGPVLSSSAGGPTANDDTGRAGVPIPVLANDLSGGSLIQPDTVSVARGGESQLGSVLFDPSTGDATYTPMQGASGTDEFQYQVCDMFSKCDVATVRVWIDDGPIVRADGYTIAPGSTGVRLPVLDNDEPGSSATLDETSLRVINATVGTFFVDNGELVYDAPPTATTPIVETLYEVCDVNGKCGRAPLSIVLSQVLSPSLRNPPRAFDVSVSPLIPGASTLVQLLPEHVLAGSNPLDPTSFRVSRGPFGGSAFADVSSGSASYTSRDTFSGLDSFRYEVCDTIGLCTSAVVRIPVTTTSGSDIGPIALSDAAYTQIGTPVQLNVLENDLMGSSNFSTVTLSQITQSNGNVSVALNGILMFSPSSAFEGVASFVYTVCDANLLCSSADVSIVVGSRLPEAQTIRDLTPNQLAIQFAAGQPVEYTITALDPYMNVVFNAPEDAFSATLCRADSGICETNVNVTSSCDGTFFIALQPEKTGICYNHCVTIKGSADPWYCVDWGCEGFISFTETGVRVDVRLQTPSDMCNLYGEFDCSALITNVDLLGEGAYCVWEDNQSFQIFLGPGASLNAQGTGPNDMLFMDCSCLRLFNNSEVEHPRDGGCANPTVRTSFEGPPEPKLRLVAPTIASFCGQITLDASGTTLAGGRPMRWVWDSSDSQLAMYLANISSPNVVIPGDVVTAAVNVGDTVIFTVTGTNHLDQTATESVAVTIVDSGQSYSSMVIEPASPFQVNAVQVLKFHVYVNNADCSGAVELYPPPSSSHVVTWQRHSGPLFSLSHNRTVNQPTVVLQENTLAVGSQYIIEARSTLPSDLSGFSYSRRVVSVRRRAPSVELVGGSARLFPLGDRDLVMDCSRIRDWDNNPNPFSIAWTCFDTTKNRPCFDNQNSALYLVPNQPVIRIPPSLFSLGLYQFTCTVEKPGGLSASSTSIIQTNGTAPDVQIYKSDGGIVSGDVSWTRSLTLRTRVRYDQRFGPLKYNWTVTSQNVDLASQAVDGVHQPWLTIPAGVLASDARYTFRVSVYNSEGVGWAEYSVVANDRPNGGSCSLAANSGDHTMIQCRNFEDRQSDPLMYIFKARPVPSEEPPIEILLSFGTHFANRLWFNLLPGDYVIVAEVWDSFGTAVTVEELPYFLKGKRMPACPEVAALDLAKSTNNTILSLDGAQLIQAIQNVARLLAKGRCEGNDAARDMAVSWAVDAAIYRVRSQQTRDAASSKAQLLALLTNLNVGSLTQCQLERIVSHLLEMSQWISTNGDAKPQQVTQVRHIYQNYLYVLDGVMLSIDTGGALLGERLSSKIIQVLNRMNALMLQELFGGEPALVTRSATFLSVLEPVPSNQIRTPYGEPNFEFGFGPKVQDAVMGESIEGPFEEEPAYVFQHYLFSEYNYHVQETSGPVVTVSFFNSSRQPLGIDSELDISITAQNDGGQPAHCVSLDSSGAWNPHRCTTKATSNYSTVHCTCTRLSTFSLAPGLISAPPFVLSEYVGPGAIIAIVLSLILLILLLLLFLWLFLRRKQREHERQKELALVSRGVPPESRIPADNFIGVGSLHGPLRDASWSGDSVEVSRSEEFLRFPIVEEDLPDRNSSSIFGSSELRVSSYGDSRSGDGDFESLLSSHATEFSGSSNFNSDLEGEDLIHNPEDTSEW